MELNSFYHQLICFFFGSWVGCGSDLVVGSLVCIRLFSNISIYNLNCIIGYFTCSTTVYY